MPETSLRAYGREIDELIEREKLDEAIAQCRYILQTYPKHLETYRHLGKAYLEAKRYGDAADIFQRVLSAVPDDFVSHVGMAIVREDEGNLDAAIWHMERAFETNPSNPAIQQEMKRLISRRDGLEPHKVRLTRGALARMYAHGELFAQAIAELRSALQEDAERPDLQVLLASMYWQTDQRRDATSVSNQILEKLPYCAEANRILAANLQANDRIEEAAVYHRRLANLDPYAAFVESALMDSKSVEESAVSLEKLDWVAGEPLPSAAPGQPGWATTLGMEMQEGSGDDVPESTELPQTGPLPSWLEPGEPPPFEAAAEKELREEMENQAADGTGDLPGAGFLDDLEGEITDEAGAYAIEGSRELSESEFLEGIETETADKENSPSESEEQDTERRGLGFAAAAAGIVAGVLGKDDKEDTNAAEDSEAELDAKGEVAAAAADGFIADEDIETEALAKAEADIGPGGEAVVAAGMVDQAESEEASETASDLGVPGDDINIAGEAPMDTGDSRSGYEQSAVDGPKPEGTPEGDIPEWMQEAGWGESKGEFEDAPVSFSDHELESLDAGGVPAEAPADDEVELTPAELPDWIHDIAPEEAEGGSDEAGDEGLPDWIAAEAPSDGGAVAEATPSGAEFEASNDSGETEASVSAAESDTGEIPTWITDDPPGATESIVTWLEDRGPDSQETDADASEDLPDWMRDTGPLDESLDDTAPSVEIPVDEKADSELEVPPTESPMAGDSRAETGEDSPASDSWLSAVAAVAADEEEPEPPIEEETLEIDQEMASSEQGEMEISDHEPEQDVPSFAAAAEALSEISSPTDEIEADAAGVVEDPGTPEPGLADQFEPSDSSSAPDWLEQIGTLPEQPMQTDSGDWLEGLEIDGEESPAEPTADTPDWLKGLAEEGSDGDESGAGPAADWLREIGEPGSVSEEQAAEVSDLSSQDEPAGQVEETASGGAPDWLQRVVAVSSEETQAVSEAEDSEVEILPAPAEEDSEVMDWLHDLAAKQAESPDDDELEATPQADATAPVIEDREIPDAPDEGLEWLEQLADQRGMDVDVSVPGQTSPAPISPEPEAEPDSESAPGWLGRMATQPIPKVDMGALEAAARGEQVSPDAETIDAQAADLQAHRDQSSPDVDAVTLGPDTSDDIAPDDLTIEASVSDLPAETVPETETSAPDTAAVSEEEIPDWLIAAAEQAEPAGEAPSGPPAEFVDVADEIAVEPGPASSADTQAPLEDAVRDASAEDEYLEEIQPSDAATDDVGVEWFDAGNAEDIEPGSQDEILEVLEPAVSAEDEPPEVEKPAEPISAEEVAEPASLEIADEVEPAAEDSTVPEPRKKEDLLERSRQALASGDTESAAELYGDLVKRKDSLDRVIEDLRIAVDRAPDNADLWQVLGDAYMRDDQTDQAIDAYRKGMEAV